MNVNTPVLSNDAANKDYVDNMLGSLSAVLEYPIVSAFYDDVVTNGINSVSLQSAVSALFCLIKHLANK